MSRFLFVLGWLVFFSSPTARGQGFGFFADPRAEAEYLALEVSGELRPPIALADAIEADLSAIRTTFPQYASISAFPDWMPGEILIGMTAPAYADFKAGTFTGFLPHYFELGVPEVTTHDFGTWIHMRFGQMYHGVRLAELFDFVNGVRYVDPNGLFGDGDDIEARSDRTYKFWRKWGDCPSGCIYSQSWDFYVTEDGAFLGTPPIAHSLPGDFNGDGFVDASDYTVWRDGLGTTYDEGDYADFINNFGASLGSAAGSSTSVPEPGGMALALSCLLSASSIAIRRRQSRAADR